MLDEISYKFQGLSSIDCNFQGLEFLIWNSRTFKVRANPDKQKPQHWREKEEETE